jgi:hypothetical protein
MTHRLDPYIREQVLLYLQKRFDSEVEIQSVQISLPKASSLRMYLTHRRGAWATIRGSGILLRYKGRRDIPAMFAMKSFRFDVDLAAIFDNTRQVRGVEIDGMEINVPPKDDRPTFQRPRRRRATRAEQRHDPGRSDYQFATHDFAEGFGENPSDFQSPRGRPFGSRQWRCDEIRRCINQRKTSGRNYQ